MKIGDVIVLASGSPPMTVVGVDGDEVVCDWFDAHGYQTNSFPATCVMPIEHAGPMAVHYPADAGRIHVNKGILTDA